MTAEEHPFHPSHPQTLADQDAFREARRDGLYSTDSVSILQLSRYGSPMSVYLDKVEPLAPAEPVSLQAWLGWQLEDALAQLYAERYGVDTPVRMGMTYTHPDIPFIKTHLDFASGKVLLEGKTRMMKGHAWGPDGSGKVPPDTWVQCQHELLACPQMEMVRIPVLFGFHTFHVYEVPRDPRFIEGLEHELVRWWTDHVVARVPPPLTSVPRDVAYSKRHRMEEPGLSQATPEMEALFRRVRLAALAVSQAEAAKDALDAQVRELIGKKEGYLGDFGKVTYRPTNGRTDWKLLSGTYRKALDAILDLVEAVRPGMSEAALVRNQVEAAQGLYTKPGSRTLRYDWAAEDEGATE